MTEKLTKQSIEDLLKKKNVVSIGEGQKIKRGINTGRECIVVGVRRKIPLTMLGTEDIIPKWLDEQETDVQELGTLEAPPPGIEAVPTDKWRPAPGGVSIGHEDITAGTLGLVAKHGDSLVILSNNHVLANSNQAQMGDDIYQPGPYDGGTPVDKIATLYNYVMIDFLGGYNKIDAALAWPSNQSDLRKDILEIGEIEGTEAAKIGMTIQKYGRTTKRTIGTVNQINAIVRVNYESGNYALFSNQIIAGAMSAGGDSGSLVVTKSDTISAAEAKCLRARMFTKISNFVAQTLLRHNVTIKMYKGEPDPPAPKLERAVGLLFAGSDTTTVINPIDEVIYKLGITI